jgi:hypothetical protein
VINQIQLSGVKHGRVIYAQAGRTTFFGKHKPPTWREREVVLCLTWTRITWSFGPLIQIGEEPAGTCDNSPAPLVSDSNSPVDER